MRSLEAVQILRERLPDDALVVSSLGTPSYLLHAAGDRHLNFYLWAAMGMASSVGLGRRGKATRDWDRIIPRTSSF